MRQSSGAANLWRLGSASGAKIWSYVGSVMLGGVGGISIPLMTSVVLKYTLDSVTRQNYTLFIDALVGVGVAILLLFENFLFSFLVERYAKQIIGFLRHRLFHHVGNLRALFFDSTHSGEILSRMTNDVNVVDEAFSMELVYFYSVVLSGAAAISTMLVFNWRLGLIGVAIGLVTTMSNHLFVKPARRLGEEIQASNAGQTSALSDMLAGMRVMRLFGLTEHQFRVFDTLLEDATLRRQRQAAITGMLTGLNRFFDYAGFIGMLAIGACMMARGLTSIGSIVAVIQLQSAVTGSFSELGSSLTSMQQSFVGADRVGELVGAPEEPNRYDLPTPGSCKSAAIELRNVAFSYRDEHAVRNVSLSIRQGEVAALVGPSGQGKSTLFKLLLGFYPPTSGDVCIAGKPLGMYTLKELRAKFAYVSQETFLFEGTVYANIALGRPGVSFDEVIAAAEAANADAFIQDLELGYQTPVGERGARLSGGQRQRIAIARAIVRNAPILLLDEPTASLDRQSEAYVQGALSRLMQNRTTLVITHRLETIQRANVIFVMNQGEIVETGTHRDLLDRGGIYSRLYDALLATPQG